MCARASSILPRGIVPAAAGMVGVRFVTVRRARFGLAHEFLPAMFRAKVECFGSALGGSGGVGGINFHSTNRVSCCCFHGVSECGGALAIEQPGVAKSWQVC